MARKKTVTPEKPPAREAHPRDEIVNRIIKQGRVAWRNCQWLQPENLKSQSPEQHAKLKRSMKTDGFAAPFYVWEPEPGKIYILDGHHRQPALRELVAEGVTVPDELPAVWIQVRNLAEAKRLVLIYSSRYANVTRDGLEEFLADLDRAAVLQQIDLPDISFDEPKHPTPKRMQSDDIRFILSIELQSEGDLRALFERLTEEGYQCRIIT